MRYYIFSIVLLAALSAPISAAGQCNWADKTGCAEDTAVDVDSDEYAREKAARAAALQHQRAAQDNEKYQARQDAANAQVSSYTSYTRDEEDGACAILLCMTQPQSPKECRKGIQKFENIRKTKHGHFSPSRTADARRKKLDECGGANDAAKAAIISTWGGQPYIVGGWKFY